MVTEYINQYLLWRMNSSGYCHVLAGYKLDQIKKNTETAVVVSVEIGLEVNAGKTKYMAMYGDQNAGRSDSVKTDNSSFDRLEQFRYLGRTLKKKIIYLLTYLLHGAESFLRS